MKCAKCLEDKSESDFSWKVKSKNRRQCYCKKCNIEYHKIHYQKNKNDYLLKADVWQKKMAAMVNDIKRKPCVDCGGIFNPWQMDFDHLRNKEFNISAAAGRLGVSGKRLMDEIAKCELVCANCHRDRTHKRRFLPDSVIGRPEPFQGS